MGEECPCKGKLSTSWHYQRKLPTCELSRHTRLVRKNAVRQEIETKKTPKEYGRWIAGTPILIPEIDPL